MNLKDLGINGLGDILKKAQDVQEKLTHLQEEMQKRTVEASAGGGMVTAVVDGKLRVVELRIDPSLVGDGDLEMLQDLVVAAVNEGVRRAQQMMAEEMSKLTGGLPIPGLGG